jgi:cell division protein FtsA
MEMAEEIKKQYVNFHSENNLEVDEIEMYNPDLQINETFKISEVNSVAKARIEEIFMFINRELRKIGKNSQLPGGAVLVGGGSALKGIEEIAKDILKLPIFKYAFDRNIVEFVPDYNGDPAFINVIALAAYSLYHSEDMASYKVNKGNSPTRSSGNDSANSVGNMLKRLWPFS